jgi:hypothetical protein
VEFPGRLFATFLGAVMASLAACSSHEQHPKQIEDCVGSAAECAIGGSVGSGSTGSTSATDGGSCGLLTFLEPCQTCAENSCCSLIGLCSNNADCLSLAVDCIGKCTTQSCVDNCKTMMPNGAADFDALDQCLASSCSSECGATDAGAPPPSDAAVVGSQSCGRLAYQSVACQTCVEAGCCDAAEMCASDPDCFLYVQCQAMCTPADTKCITDCQTTNPLGQANYTHLGQCVQSKCSTQCQ